MDLFKKIKAIQIIPTLGFLVLLLLSFAPPVLAAGVPVGPSTSLHQERPRINGAKIVWLEGGFSGFPGTADVVLYDLTVGARSQVTAAGVADKAAVFGNNVVWEDHRKPSGFYPDTDIYRYFAPSSLETTVSDRITTQYSPDIWGTKVVWYEFVDNTTKWDIFIKDTSTGVETKLNIPGDQANPRIYGDKVVFEDWSSGKSNITMYDTSTSTYTPITNLGGSYQYEPDINQDKIVFSDTRNGNLDIYFYDISNPVTNGTQITTQTSDQSAPAIGGGTAVWVDTRAGNKDIYGYNFATGLIWSIESNSARQEQPDIDGDRVIWTDYRGGVDGRIYTVLASLTIVPPDTKAPSASLTAPWLSTIVTKTTKFKIKWSGSDPSPSSGIASYDVQYKVYGGSWRNWKTNTTAKAAYFKGRPGKTYYFRARAKDSAGNIGKYSKAKRTIVPFDNGSLIRKRVGFGRTYKNNKSRYYRNTLRYSTRAGDVIAYRFTGRGVYLISTKSKTRSKAKIYMDGRYIKTINTWSRRSKYRQIVFKKAWSRRKTHTIKIINVGNKKRLDIDGLAVRK